ncbi:hypothetical protein A6769_40000 [Nostoc punctiforme NIES-2108]|uniref:Uncharacterized protein n=1 Tax=Nostoc punctiforme NIES-2108 TaxID=1356359 RepID=A0A367RQG1_NOSPU|nr:hypothetical protein A6769_40000 [Nostoc punctiforme NIES-2108]
MYNEYDNLSFEEQLHLTESLVRQRHNQQMFLRRQLNWIKSRTNPVCGNRNTDEFITRLRLGYQLLYGGVIW